MTDKEFLESINKEIRIALSFIELSNDPNEEVLKYLSCKFGVLKEDIDEYRKKKN